MFGATKVLMSGDSNADLGYWITYINDGGNAEQGATIDSSGNSYLLTSSGNTGQIVQFDIDGALTDQYGLTNTVFTSCFHTGSVLQVAGYATDSGSTAHYSRWTSGTLTEAENHTLTSGTVFKAYGICETGSNIAFCGYSTVSGVTYANAWITGGTGGNSSASAALAAASAGQEYIWGVSLGSSVVYTAGRIPNGTYTAGHISEINAVGTINWQRELTSASVDTGLLGVASTATDAYVAGNIGSNTLFVANYDDAGAIQWQRKLSPSGNYNQLYRYAYGDMVCIDSSDNVYICGVCNLTTPSCDVGFIAKYNSSGTIQWQRYLGPVGAGLNSWVNTVKWLGSALYVFGGLELSEGNYYSFAARIPDDGTLTGNHGGITYAAAGAAEDVGGLTDAAGDATRSAAATTSGADASTQSDPSYTDTKILVN